MRRGACGVQSPTVGQEDLTDASPTVDPCDHRRASHRWRSARAPVARGHRRIRSACIRGRDGPDEMGDRLETTPEARPCRGRPDGRTAGEENAAWASPSQRTGSMDSGPRTTGSRDERDPRITHRGLPTVEPSRTLPQSKREASAGVGTDERMDRALFSAAPLIRALVRPSASRLPCGVL